VTGLTGCLDEDYKQAACRPHTGSSHGHHCDCTGEAQSTLLHMATRNPTNQDIVAWTATVRTPQRNVPQQWHQACPTTPSPQFTLQGSPLSPWTPNLISYPTQHRSSLSDKIIPRQLRSCVRTSPAHVQVLTFRASRAGREAHLSEGIPPALSSSPGGVTAWDLLRDLVSKSSIPILSVHCEIRYTSPLSVS
jgi:hypothetical protein